MQRAMDALANQLAAAIGAGSVTDDPEELATYGRDWTKVVPPRPSLVVFPRSTDEVARVVKICAAAGVAIVPSGGRTGLAAGAVASNGEVVLSLSRMRRMGDVDPRALTLHVEAGAITEAVHQHCEPFGLTWPVDFASKGSSTVGGNIATNAGGVKVIRYGLTRQWVLGLVVVTASGEILRLNGALEKNNTGADLRQLFIGSEGTLGIVTEATLKLTRVPGHLDVMLFAVKDLAAVLALFDAARRGPFVLSAFEMFTERCFSRLSRHRKVVMPIAAHAGPDAHYVLVEVEAGSRDAIESWLADLMDGVLVTDGTLAENAQQARSLWELREGISESLSATGLPHKNDIALPIAELPAFCAALDALFAKEWPGFEVCVFGHIGDGNLHVNVMKPDTMPVPEFLEHAKAGDRAMFDLVRAHRGSISAEHGIGLLKKPYLSYSRAPEEMALLRGLKTLLDPRGILNPGKIFD
jgi:FAD/FMN-containing dehydrogenase